MSEQDSNNLSQALEELSRLSIEKLKEIVQLEIDEENGQLLRAICAAANTALNTQVRADAIKLQHFKSDKTLELLLKLISDKQELVPGRGLLKEQTEIQL